MDGDNFNSTADDNAANTDNINNTQSPVSPMGVGDFGGTPVNQNQSDAPNDQAVANTPENPQEDSNGDASSTAEQDLATPNDSAKATDEPMDDILYLYKARLIEDLGFKDLPDIEKKQIEEKIDTLINQRILNLLLLYIPKEKAEELADKAESGDEAEFYKFVAENIPGWSDKVFKELELIKDEVLGKTDNLNG
ncbi:MAG: hypothetical protein BWY19_00883 [bacterium ADurb.Bin212]|nr:MAG: hypothetical protein BWY19_00883 [bacterium ADurb.Bin212]